MRHALTLARAASRAGEVPVGAIIVSNGKVIAEAANRTITLHDPTAHAEILALRAAALHLQNYRLTGCEVFSTLEPCAMCAGALLHARISRLVFAAPDPKAGAAGSVLSILNHPQLNHQMQVESGLYAAESSALLQEFFRGKRGISDKGEG